MGSELHAPLPRAQTRLAVQGYYSWPQLCLPSIQELPWLQNSLKRLMFCCCNFDNMSKSVDGGEFENSLKTVQALSMQILQSPGTSGTPRAVFTEIKLIAANLKSR